MHSFFCIDLCDITNCFNGALQQFPLDFSKINFLLSHYNTLIFAHYLTTCLARSMSNLVLLACHDLPPYAIELGVKMQDKRKLTTSVLTQN